MNNFLKKYWWILLLGAAWWFYRSRSKQYQKLDFGTPDQRPHPRTNRRKFGTFWHPLANFTAPTATDAKSEFIA